MKVVTFGEIMLRLAPMGNLKFLQSDNYEATFGGGEANVAVSLANYGIDVCFVSKLPTHEIGQCAFNALRNYGVDTSYIVRGGERVGIYYLEKGASQRASKVIYDRNNSAIATANVEDFDWDTIFEGVDCFHFTGITPAISKALANITLLALKKAKEKGIMVTCDLNYRKKLWSCKEAQETMKILCQYVDVCIANEEDAADVFDIHASQTDITSGEINRDGYIEVAKKLQEQFHFSCVAITLRESISASNNRWSAMLYKNEQAYFSKKYDLHIVDRVGGGDSFAGGLIYSLLHHYNEQETIEFAVAASALKHSIQGDFNLVSVEEIKTLCAGDGSGRVQR